MEKRIILDRANIDKEHICCAIADKKCKDSYELKKDWLRQEFDNGYVFLCCYFVHTHTNYTK